MLVLLRSLLWRLITPLEPVTFSDGDAQVDIEDRQAEGTLSERALITAPYTTSETLTLAESGTVVSTLTNVSTSDTDGSTISESAVVTALLVALDSRVFAEQGIVAVDGTEVYALAEASAMLASISSTEPGTYTDIGEVQGPAIAVLVSSSDTLVLLDDGHTGNYRGYAVGTVLIVARVNGTGHVAERLAGTAHVEV